MNIKVIYENKNETRLGSGVLYDDENDVRAQKCYNAYMCVVLDPITRFFPSFLNKETKN